MQRLVDALPIDLRGWLARPYELLSERAAVSGDGFWLRVVPGRPWWVVSTPEAMRDVFTASSEVLCAGESNEILLPVVGASSVLVLDGRSHMRQRKLLLPAFHGEYLERFEQEMREAARAEVSGWPVDGVLELWPRMQNVTLDVIVRVVFGMRAGPRRDSMTAAIKRLVAMASRPAILSVVSLLPRRGLIAIGRRGPLARVLGPVEQLLAQEIGDRRSVKGDGQDLLSRLLQATDESGRPLSDEELRDTLITVLLAGHETTGTAMAWVLERLMRQPVAMERASEDVRYLRAAIVETLRLRPIAPIVVRRVKQEIEIDGVVLRPGCEVAPCPLLLHVREDVYPDARRFAPERWLERTPGTYEWVPFGGGTRRCLGAAFAMLEMQAVLDEILASVQLSATESAAEQPIRRSVTLAPARSARARIRRREQVVA
jgi:cytochrome P450